MTHFGTAFQAPTTISVAGTVPPASLKIVRQSRSVYGQGVIFPEYIGGPGAPGDDRPSGDYPGRAFHGSVPTTEATVYTSESNVTLVITEIGFLNPTVGVIEVSLSIGNVARIEDLEVPAGASIGDNMTWEVLPGEPLKLSGSAPGVIAFIEGVEVVN